MLIITDIVGNTEALTGYKGLKRFRSVSGEKTLAFLIFPTDQNAHSFDMVQEESIIEFKGDTYRIKQVSEKPRGKTYFKEVVALHTLFDLIDEYIYETFTGSKTFQSFLQFVFSGTPYTWDIVDSFLAQDWENLGDDNRVALFQQGLKRYGAEFALSGTHFTFKQEIGNDTDFQFRYGYNIKTINRNVNTNNLSTYIKGFGKKNEDGSYLIQSEYTSPNAAIFGIRHAKPVSDERYTTVEGLNERLKVELTDSPEVSITLDFVDLRSAGFPYDVPSEGDDVFLFYEPMKLDLETRIMDIMEEFTEYSDYPIKTDVTLANFRNNMTDKFVEFSRTQKQVDGLFNGNKQLPYNALDDAVKRATAALQRAETELEFENGIIARDKNNPNFLVLFNSNGIGISRDGGQTFKEALTSDGFVASAGVIGQFAANNIQIGPDTTFELGYDPTQVKKEIDLEIADVNKAVTDLDIYVDGAFKDGVISAAEAAAIEKYINQINTEKADVDSKYTSVYGTDELANTNEKTALSTAKTNYNTAHTNLISSINTAITDGKTSATEKADVDTKYAAYKTSLGSLSTAFEIAVRKIAQVKVDNVTIGGRNLVKNTAFKDNSMSGWTPWGTSVASIYDSPYYKKGIHIQRVAGQSNYGVHTPSFYLEKNTQYTVSFLFQSRYNSGFEQDYVYLRSMVNGESVTVKKLANYNLSKFPNVFGSTAIWKVSFQVDHAEDIPEARILLGRTDNGGLENQGFIIAELKIETGNKPTDYSPAPEDVADDILDEATKVRDDLRLTAPLPTSLTLNQDGIRASTSDPNRYAQIDYRGFYVKGGAVQIERPDGYLSVMDGIMRNSFGIQGSIPAFKTAGVVEAGQFFRTNAQNRFENIQRFVFKHDSRYIRIIANMYCDGGLEYGNVGMLSFDVFDDAETTSIATVTVSETRHSTNQGYRKDILLDLGTPTGQLYVMYWRMYSSTTYHTYGSIRYLVQEG